VTILPEPADTSPAVRGDVTTARTGCEDPAVSAARRTALVVVGLVLLSFNLRPAAVSVGPVLEEVRDGLALSGPEAGLLTSLPVLAFAVFGALAPTFARLVGLHRPGERVKLGVLRGSQPSTLGVRLGQRSDLEGAGPLRPAPPEPDGEEGPPEEMVPMRLGVEIGEVTPEVEEAIGRRGPGALVLSVEPGSPAERAGLQPGLVIVEVAGHPVHSVKEASELIQAARAQPPIVFKLLGPGRVSAVATVQP